MNKPRTRTGHFDNTGMHSALDLGIRAANSGDFAGAIPLFEAAVRQAPDDSSAHHNLAVALAETGQVEKAVCHLVDALCLRPPVMGAAKSLAVLLDDFRPGSQPDVDPRGMERALTCETIDRQPLVQFAFAWMKAHGDLAKVIEIGRRDGWDAAAKRLLSASPARLMFRCLEAGINTDIEIECLLTAVRRRVLLDTSQDMLHEKPVYELVCALIHQCCNNEQVFYASENEQRVVNELRRSLETEPPSTKELNGILMQICLYTPAFELLPIILDHFDISKIRPRTLQNILNREDRVLRREQELAATIESFGKIADRISRKVAQQYENNPYPRWMDLTVPTSGEAVSNLGHYFKNRELKFLDSSYAVLIAGCGTGKHAINAALAYGENAVITAVDLSRSSLAHAARMAERYGVGNLQFMQADILELDTLVKRFQIIECVGTLHHMDNPMHGWRVLTGLLEPAGIMRIGLYSELGRRNVGELRREIQERNLATDAAGIKLFRQEIISRALRGLANPVTNSKAFFSTSPCRDLLFHVQEMSFTLNEIKTCLIDLGLEFCGFDLNAVTLSRYSRAYPQDSGLTDLDSWSEFEHQHPNTFGSMYQFWCRKSPPQETA